MVLMRFAKWMVSFRASEYPQIHEKPLRSKSTAGDSVPVRVRSPAPKIGKLRQRLADFTYYFFPIHSSLKPRADF